MFKIFAKLFSPTKKLEKVVKEINTLEPEIEKLTDEQLGEESEKLRKIASPTARNDGENDIAKIRTSDVRRTSDVLAPVKKELPPPTPPYEGGEIKVLPRAFALIREAAKRTLGQRHFDVQLMGGIALHQGKVAEMVTGEGKTLAATAPAYLNALTGKGVHIITVNDYLAKRDAVWMGQIYHALGMSVACLVHEGAYLYDPKYRPENPKSQIPNPKQIQNPNDQNTRRDEKRDELGSFKVEESYLRPITRREAYRADIVYGANHEFGFDYLRDNLAPAAEAQVQRGYHFAIIDEVDSILIDEARTPLIISAPDAESSGFYKVFARIVAGLQKKIDYEVDEKMRSATITQEGIDKVESQLKVDLYKPENLRLNHYLQEMLKAYGLHQRDKDYVVKDGQVIIVDQFTGRLLPGRRYSAGLHQAIEAKEGVAVQNESRTYAQISIQNYFRLYQKLAGMTGTAQTSAEEFNKVYGLEVITIPTNKPLIRKMLPDVIYKTREAKLQAIIKKIGELQSAGRPVLAGTPSIEHNEELSRLLNRAGVRHEVLNAKNHEREGAIIAQAGRAGAVTVATNMAGRGVDIILGGNPPDPEEARKISELGGLHVIGMERHEARRIDNQLRGRAGRQGDPGSSQFYLSLEDDLLRVFGGERIQRLMTSLKIPEDEPISAGLVSKAVEGAQSKIEGINFDARKHLLDYDDVLNRQRLAIYKKRQELPTSNLQPPTSNLSVLDLLWMNHLENIEALMDAVRLRAYGQHDPLVEFRREAHILYKQLLADFDKWLAQHETLNMKHETKRDEIRSEEEHPHPISLQPDQFQNSKLEIKNFSSNQKIGRNAPCPCGAIKIDGRPVKYKHCHGKSV